MPRSNKTPKTPMTAPARMAVYRARMRASGLRMVQIWMPDTRSAAFSEACRRQSRAIAAQDPAGDDLLRFVSDVYEWPDT